VQRNIPVTFGRNPVEVINETIDPEGDAAHHEGDPGSSAGENELPPAPAKPRAKRDQNPAAKIPVRKERKD
jgi:hypothetical protein